MTETDKLYEQALALLPKAFVRPWYTHGTEVCSDGGQTRKWLVANCDRDECTDSLDELHAALIVAAVNLLDALPKLKAEWEREARRKALEEAALEIDQANREGPYNVIQGASRIRALQQPAAQEEEERT